MYSTNVETNVHFVQQLTRLGSFMLAPISLTDYFWCHLTNAGINLSSSKRCFAYKRGVFPFIRQTLTVPYTYVPDCAAIPKGWVEFGL